jgi:uncharacterized protein YacL
MSERWKYQLKVGLIWGLLMTLMSTFLNDKTVTEEIKSVGIYLKFLLNFVVGTLVMGYLFWKGKNPKNNSWSTLFKSNKKEN